MLSTMFIYLLTRLQHAFLQHSCSWVHVIPFSCAVPSHAAANTCYTNTHLHCRLLFHEHTGFTLPLPLPQPPTTLDCNTMHKCTGDNGTYLWHVNVHIPDPPLIQPATPPPPPPTQPNTTHLCLFPGRLPSVQSLRKEEVAIFLNGQKDEASHQGAQVVDHIVHTCTQTHAPLVPKQMPHESQTMRTLLHIHAKNRIWTPVARRLLQPGFEHQGKKLAATRIWTSGARHLLQPGFEHQGQEACCNQDLNTRGKTFAATRIWTPVARRLLQPGSEHQWQDACCNQDLNTRGKKLAATRIWTPGARHLLQPGLSCSTSGKKLAANRIWTPGARSLLQPLTFLVLQTTNVKNCHTYMLKTGSEHQWQEVCCNLSHSYSYKLPMLQENCHTHMLITKFKHQRQEACCKWDLNTSGKKFAATRILNTRGFWTPGARILLQLLTFLVLSTYQGIAKGSWITEHQELTLSLSMSGCVEAGAQDQNSEATFIF